MLSLIVISLCLSIFIGYQSARLYRIVYNKDLGYEEIIAVAILLGASINICIDALNIFNHVSPTFVNIKLSLVSRLTQGLISYSMIQYMLNTHSLRLSTKEK